VRDLDYILAQALVHTGGMTPKSAATRAMLPYVKFGGRKSPPSPNGKRVVNERTMRDAVRLTPEHHRYWRPSFEQMQGLDRPYGQDPQKRGEPLRPRQPLDPSLVEDINKNVAGTNDVLDQVFPPQIGSNPIDRRPDYAQPIDPFFARTEDALRALDQARAIREQVDAINKSAPDPLKPGHIPYREALHEETHGWPWHIDVYRDDEQPQPLRDDSDRRLPDTLDKWQSAYKRESLAREVRSKARMQQKDRRAELEKARKEATERQSTPKEDPLERFWQEVESRK